jgi:hypothetical protein
MKPKMSLDKKACVDISGKFVQMIEISLLLAVFGVIVLIFIQIASTGIVANAETRLAELALDVNASAGLVALYELLANEAVIEIMLTAAFIIVVIFTILALIRVKGKR